MWSWHCWPPRQAASTTIWIQAAICLLASYKSCWYSWLQDWWHVCLLEICTVLFNGILRAATLDLFRFIKRAHKMQTKKQSKVTAAAAIGSMAEKVLGAGMTSENNPKYAIATGVVEYPSSRGPASKQKRWVLRLQKKKKKKQLEKETSFRIVLRWKQIYFLWAVKGSKGIGNHSSISDSQPGPGTWKLSWDHRSSTNRTETEWVSTFPIPRIQFTRTRRTGRTRMWVLSSCPAVVSLCWSSSGRREGWNPIMGFFNFFSLGQFWVPV